MASRFRGKLWRKGQLAPISQRIVQFSRLFVVMTVHGHGCWFGCRKSHDNRSTNNMLCNYGGFAAVCPLYFIFYYGIRVLRFGLLRRFSNNLPNFFVTFLLLKLLFCAQTSMLWINILCAKLCNRILCILL